MKTSWDGIKFICCREALVRVAYHDGDHPDGTPKYSIGFGSQTPVVVPGDTITVEEAFNRMITHIEKSDEKITERLKVAVKQYEWDAIASLYYQSGTIPFEAVVEILNRRRPSSWGIREFAHWHRDSDGLLGRRLEEIALARTNNYGDITTYKYFDGDPKQVQAQERAFPPVQPMRS